MINETNYTNNLISHKKMKEAYLKSFLKSLVYQLFFSKYFKLINPNLALKNMVGIKR